MPETEAGFEVSKTLYMHKMNQKESFNIIVTLEEARCI